MSKQKKEQQKKRKKEQVRKERLAKYRAELTAKVGRDDGFLDHIFDLTIEKDYIEARGQLLAYVKKYPKYPQPYVELAKICAEMGDHARMYWATEQLLQVGQRTFEDYLLYQSACAMNDMPAVLLDCIEYMERRFRYDSEVDIPALRTETLNLFKNAAARVGSDLTPYTDEQLLELMRLHERSMLYLALHRFDEAIRCCEEMTSRFPFFASGYSNKVLATMFDRGPDAAEPLLQHALEKHPEAIFVIAFKIRQLALLGRHEEIPAYCERLAATPSLSENTENYLMGKIEAFAWANDLERVIETYQLAKKELENKWDVDKHSYALATHYAAAAYALQGDRETAIRLWKLLPPDLIDTATENLADIQKPIGKRNGPWFFNYEHWIPFQVHTILRQETAKTVKDKQLDEEERNERFAQCLAVAAKKIVNLCPSFDRLLGEILKRGAPDCQTFVQMFIGRVDTPIFRAALLEFVQGKSGTDERRNEFAMALSKRDWLESDSLKIWIEGKQHEIKFTSTEIYWDREEPKTPEEKEMHDVLAKAQRLAQKRNYKGAIKLLNEFNNETPGQPTILYNIATYRAMLGDDAFFDETVDQLVRDFPDYIFAKTAYARRLCVQRRLDEAWEILRPLQSAKRLYIAEYKAFSVAMIMYHLAKGERETAKSLHRSCAEVCAGSFPRLEQLQNELDAG